MFLISSKIPTVMIFKKEFLILNFDITHALNPIDVQGSTLL